MNPKIYKAIEVSVNMGMIYLSALGVQTLLAKLKAKAGS